jgi:long-chain acyl-CoA synthetase
VPVHATLPAGQAEQILYDSESRAVFVSGAEQLEKVSECLSRMPTLLHVFSLDEVEGREDVLPLDALVARGRVVENAPSYRDLIAATGKNDPASIIYTSGTTARPKGVALSHWNFASNAHACLAGFFVMMYAGATICYARAIETAGEDMRSQSPTVICSVPRWYEKVHAKIMESVASQSALRRRLFHWAIDVGERNVSERLRGRGGPGAGMRARQRVADALVLRKLRKQTGGRLRFFISGGAPLPREIAEFFHAAGMPILEGYGLTETSPVISVNTLDHMKFGSVGRPLPGVEVKVADDGELLVRGDNVMQGYFKMPDETAEVIHDGWFSTGDIGHLDDDGFVVITDRKKDIIVTATGKNIAPQVVEGRLKSSGYIAEAVLVGNQRRFVSVIIVPDFDKLEEYARAHDITWSSTEELVASERVEVLYAGEVEAACEHLASFEMPKKFILLPREFSIEDGELTPSLKVKRRVVEHNLEDAIDRLYSE